MCDKHVSTLVLVTMFLYTFLFSSLCIGILMDGPLRDNVSNSERSDVVRGDGHPGRKRKRLVSEPEFDVSGFGRSSTMAVRQCIHGLDLKSECGTCRSSFNALLGKEVFDKESFDVRGRQKPTAPSIETDVVADRDQGWFAFFTFMCFHCLNAFMRVLRLIALLRIQMIVPLCVQSRIELIPFLFRSSITVAKEFGTIGGGHVGKTLVSENAPMVKGGENQQGSVEEVVELSD